jgi:hypothetical protein
MRSYLVIIRCAIHDIPVGFTEVMEAAIGAARQLTQDLKENYTLLRTYAAKVNTDAHDPICVSVYEFIDGEVSGVLSNFHLDHATHRRRSPFKHPSDDIQIAVYSE